MARNKTNPVMTCFISLFRHLNPAILYNLLAALHKVVRALKENTTKPPAKGSERRAPARRVEKLCRSSRAGARRSGFAEISAKGLKLTGTANKPGCRRRADRRPGLL